MMLVLLDYYDTLKPDEERNIVFFINLWQSIVLLQAIYVWIICPLMIVYYEGNEKDTIIKRVEKAIKAQLPVFLAIIAFIFITGYIARDVWVPELVALEHLGYQSNYEEVDDAGLVTKYYHVTTNRK